LITRYFKSLHNIFTSFFNADRKRSADVRDKREYSVNGGTHVFCNRRTGNRDNRNPFRVLNRTFVLRRRYFCSNGTRNGKQIEKEKKIERVSIFSTDIARTVGRDSFGRRQRKKPVGYRENDDHSPAGRNVH